LRTPNGLEFPPYYEPLGGLNKAVLGSWLANADGSGDWIQLNDRMDYCQWVGRTALCQKIGPDPISIASANLTAVTDDGKQVSMATSVWRWVIASGKLFYVSSTGGLYVIDGLPQPAR
jgi:hypothetical protein